MMVSSTVPSNSTQFAFKSSPEPLLSFMVSNVDALVQCTKERSHYQHMLLPSLSKFIKHIFKNCKLSPTVLVIGLIYLERLKKNLPSEAQGGKRKRKTEALLYPLTLNCLKKNRI